MKAFALPDCILFCPFGHLSFRGLLFSEEDMEEKSGGGGEKGDRGKLRGVEEGELWSACVV